MMKKIPSKLTGKVRDIRGRRRDSKLARQEGSELIPRITNDTVAVHREQVLKGARKYIYPLQHSKHKVVIITSTLFIVSVLTFATYCVTSLYKLQSSSTFLYRVTQVIPFPIARTGSSFIAYENYLFELRHYMHYYQSQQKLSFKTESGKQQLEAYKKRALDKVDDDTRIKQIASQRGISISDAEVDAQIELSRAQNRLGGSNRVFEDVIKEYYGWSLADFRRSLRSQLLQEKVNATLDTDSKTKIESAQTALKTGGLFADVVKQYSEDEASKAQNGEFGQIDRANTAVSPQTIDVLFKLKTGEVADPIIISYDTGYAYELVKNIETTGNKAKGAHIIIKIKDINTYLNDQKEKQPTRRYIKLNG
jgi:hypothetical protein